MLLLDGTVGNKVPSFTSGCLPNHRTLTSLEHPLVNVISEGSQTTSQLAQHLSKGNESSSTAERRSYTNNPYDSQHSAAARLCLFLGHLEKGGRQREREGEREKEREKDRLLGRGETRNAMSQRHLSAQMKWKRWKGNTALLFSKLYFQLNELKRKYPFLFLWFWEICLLSLQA